MASEHFRDERKMLARITSHLSVALQPNRSVTDPRSSILQKITASHSNCMSNHKCSEKIKPAKKIKKKRLNVTVLQQVTYWPCLSHVYFVLQCA